MRLFSEKRFPSMPVSRLFFLVPVALLLLLAAGSSEPVQAESHWSRWRGPQQNGHVNSPGLPQQWSSEDVVWKAPLKGRGQSSPMVWGERIFLTAALDKGRKRMVICVNQTDGRIEWERIAWTGDPEPTHHMNGWASASCTTDGERVYAFFGRGGLHCYTVDGRHVWSKDLGRFAGPWGTAACPVLVGDMLIQNCDADENARLVALDKKTGEIIWETDREDYRGWNTPILINASVRRELVLNGHTGVRAYNPQTGKELWHCTTARGRGTPTVTPAPNEDRLFILNGLPRGDIYAVEPGGKGNVTESHRIWRTTRSGGRDLPSPILIGKWLLVMNMKGILTCYDAESGEEVSLSRIGGNYSASPVALDGKAFFVKESGEIVVIKPAEKPEIVAENKVEAEDDEIFRSTLTPNRGQWLLRSTKALYCIGKRNPAEASESE